MADEQKPGETGKGNSAPEPKRIELTEAEIEQRTKAAVEAALKAERDKAADEARKAKEAADAEEAKKRGEFEKLAQQEQAKREKAEQRVAEAERKALLADVSVQLRDHLAEKHPEYLTNAPDIFLHVKEKLEDDAEPDAIAKLIADEAKAFAERTGKAKAGPPAAPSRSSRAPADLPKPQQPANGAPRFGTVTWHG